MLVFLILIIVTSFITIALTYFQVLLFSLARRPQVSPKRGVIMHPAGDGTLLVAVREPLLLMQRWHQLHMAKCDARQCETGGMFSQGACSHSALGLRAIQCEGIWEVGICW
jgi:hypothetical protein